MIGATPGERAFGLVRAAHSASPPDVGVFEPRHSKPRAFGTAQTLDRDLVNVLRTKCARRSRMISSISDAGYLIRRRATAVEGHVASRLAMRIPSNLDGP
jgi:hypothetical protein